MAAVSPANAADPEFRGIYVDAFHDGFKTPEQTTEMVNKVADANLNAIFVQVRKRGDAYYNSTIVPKADDIAPDYDPLADVIQKAHAKGLEVHAWINALNVTPSPRRAVSDAHVTVKHPEWVMVMEETGCSDTPGSSKKHLDPSLPAVREYLKGIVTEIVSRYAVDGLHVGGARCEPFGRMRSEAGVGAFKAAVGQEAIARAGGPEWMEWNRNAVTELVRGMYYATKAAKPGVAFSIVAGTPRKAARDANLEDWEAWLNEGIVDFIVPMLYDPVAFKHVLADCMSVKNDRYVLAGQPAFKVSRDKSVEQIDTARAAGADGVVIFSYHYASRAPSAGDPALLDVLDSQVFPSAARVPLMPQK